MNKIDQLALVIPAYGLAGLSVAACATFGTMLGEGWEGWLYGAIFALFDMIKFGLPALAESSLKSRRFFCVFIAVSLFLPLSAMSITSGLGIYANVVSHSSAKPKAERARYEAAIREQRDIEGRLALMTPALPGDVAAKIAALELDRKFSRSSRCADVTVEDSRELCRKHATLKGELAQAEEAKALRAKLEGVNQRIIGLNFDTVMQPINPQADAIAATLGMVGISVDKEKIPSFLAVVIVCLVELIVVVLWLARTQGAAPAAAESPKPHAEPVANKLVDNPPKIFTPDPFDEWLEAKITRNPRRCAAAEALLDCHNEWAVANQRQTLSAAMLGRKLKDAGFAKEKINGRIHYHGAAIRGDRSAVRAVS
jgi:hypothetical protein